MKLSFFTGVVIISLFVTACSKTRPEPIDIKNALDKDIEQNQQAKLEAPDVPLDVQAELMPKLGQNPIAQHSKEKYLNINAKNVDAATFFASLFQGSSYSSAIHPEVKGKITLSLQDASLSEALDLIAELYGFDIQKKGQTYHIYPAGMRVETIALNYLMMARIGKSRTTITSGRLTDNSNSNNTNDTNDDSDSFDNSTTTSSNNSKTGFNGTKIETVTDTDFWTELENTLNQLIGTDGNRTVLVSPQAGLVTVKAYPHEIRTIKDYLQVAENHLQRQVVLEAKIIEVNLEDDYQQGIDWSATGLINSLDSNLIFETSSQLAENIIKNTIGGGSALTIKNTDFNTVINLLDTQGDVNVLSSPRITASNNQKAVIKVGTDEYFVTDISNTTISGTSTVSNPSVELTPFFSGIALDVTPQISDTGEVLLHVHPSVIDVAEQRKQILMSSDADSDIGGIDIPLARSDIRESDTIVKASSDEVIVIGGLMRSYQKELVSKTPFIGDIPWLGELFTNRQKVTRKTELVILIKPILIEQDTWSQELKRSRELLEDWFPSEANSEEEN